MKDCIYQTDPAWVESLQETATRENVNFWRKDHRRMNLRPGAYFYFKERGSHSVIGRGRLVRSEFKTVSGAWDVFGLGNGAPTLDRLESQVSSVLGLEKSGNAEIQCMILEGIEWVRRPDAYELSENEFPGNVMAMRYFERGEFPGLEGIFQPADGAGFSRVWEGRTPLDARFRVELRRAELSVLFQSRGGAAKSKGSKRRNPDYARGLELLLKRLADLEASIRRIEIDTRDTEDRSAEDRLVILEGYPFPVDLFSVDDPRKLRILIGRSVARTASRSPRGGNRTKQIRLYVDLPQPGFQESARLQSILARDHDLEVGARRRTTAGEEFEQENAAIVGRKGEEYFLKWSRQRLKQWGDPKDRTNMVGLGYDVEFPEVKTVVEVKGFRGELSAIRLTEREWKTAALRRATYYLALVTNIDTSTRSVDLLKDPYGVLGTVARKSERVQITINVSGRGVKDAVRGRVDV